MKKHTIVVTNLAASANIAILAIVTNPAASTTQASVPIA